MVSVAPHWLILSNLGWQGAIEKIQITLPGTLAQLTGPNVPVALGVLCVHRFAPGLLRDESQLLHQLHNALATMGVTLLFFKMKNKLHGISVIGVVTGKPRVPLKDFVFLTSRVQKQKLSDSVSLKSWRMVLFCISAHFLCENALFQNSKIMKIEAGP